MTRRRGWFDAVLIVSFGGPQGPDDIRPFLANVLRGRRVTPERVEEVAHHYELFDGVSPHHRADAAAGGRACTRGWPPRVTRCRSTSACATGTRYLTDTLKQMHADGDPARRRLHRCGSSLLLELSAVPRERRVCAAGRCGRSRRPRRHHVRRELVRPSAVHRRQRVARSRCRAAGCRRTCEPRRDSSSPRTASRSRWPMHRGTETSALGLVCGDRRARRTDVGARLPEPQRSSGGPLARAGRVRLPAARARTRDSRRRSSVPDRFLCDHIEVLYDLDREAADRVRRSACRWCGRKRSMTIPCSST